MYRALEISITAALRSTGYLLPGIRELARVDIGEADAIWKGSCAERAVECN
jgi:hypothetical protein